MYSTDVEMDAPLRLAILQNACSSIAVTDVGIVTFCSPVSKKHWNGITVILVGIVTFVRFRQSENTEFPREVTDVGMTINWILEDPKVRYGNVLIEVGMVTSANERQLENTDIPRFVTEVGITTLCRELESKACLSIDSSDVGKFTAINMEHMKKALYAMRVMVVGM